MARIEGPAYLGPLVLDLTDYKHLLVDLGPNDLQGARAEQEGLGGVLEELAHAVPKYGADAEIHPAVYQRVVESTDGIDALRAITTKLEKAVEVARESLKRLENNREEDISEIAAKAADKGTRGKKPELLAHFQRSIEYRSRIAQKAVATRKKNEAKANGGNEEGKGE